MLTLDYRLGLFLGYGTYEERVIWERAGFTYSRARKAWTTDRAEIAERVEGAQWTQAALDHQGGLEGLARLNRAMSYAGETDFAPPLPQGLHPRTGQPFQYLGYQAAGVEYALAHLDCLIGDAPGLGKTIQAVGLSNCLPLARKILIVAPASLKVNWKREWGLWDVKGLTVGIAETRHNVKIADGAFKNGKPRFRTEVIPDFWPDTEVVIVNADILDRFEKQIKDQHWNLLVVDEAHSLKSSESYRTLFILGGRRKEKVEGERKKRWIKYLPISTDRRLFLTGTPLLNRPIELWPMCKAFDPRGLGADYEVYAYTYCGAWWDTMRGKYGGLDVSGATNKKELGQKLRAAFMIRRIKKEVMKDLPDKSRNIILLNSPAIRALVERERELAEALKLYESDMLGIVTDTEIADQIAERAALYGFGEEEGDGPRSKKLDLEYAIGITGLEAPQIEILFNEISLVRRDLGIAKAEAVIAWVREFLESGEKLVLFAYHTIVLETMYDALEDFQPGMIHGGTAVKKRQLEVDRFQNDEGCRVILLNILAGGVGHTLTRASDVAFAEGDWVPSNLLQAEDRVHRIGQESDKVMIFYLFANGSLDARMAQSSKMKEDNINEILDT